MEADLAVLKACGDKTRLRILYILCDGELCVCELVAILDMAQAKVSRHLGVLRQAGLVRDRRESVWVHYSLQRADTPLKRRLFRHLKSQRLVDEVSHQDLQRLQALERMDVPCPPSRRVRSAVPA